MSPFIWLAVAVVMAVIEIVSLSLITAWFVVGSLAAFVANLLGAGVAVQMVVFLAVSLLCLIFLRPLFLKYRRRGEDHEPTLVGQSALVCEEIDNERLVGRVETANRMTWVARSANGSVIPVGEAVVVVDRESVKLIVERKSS
ncbi:MAG: NfeD family protein [Raoultibacter sp.]